MQAFPDPASDASVLETGLTAVKQEDYQGAIAALEQYLTSTVEKDTPNSIKAQMGLIVAYSRQDRIGDAIALCQPLHNSQNRKVQDWATRMLTELSSQAKPIETGFTLLEAVPKAPRRTFELSSNHSPQRQSSQRSPKMTAAQTETLSSSTLSSSKIPLTLKTLPSSSPSSHSTPHNTHLWRNAGRSQRWQPLTKLSPARLQWAEMGTIAALLLLICGLFASTSAVQVLWLRFATKHLKWSAFIPPISTPFWFIVLALVGLFIASPWILDALLKYLYGMRSLSTASLAKYSAETHRLLPRFSQQHHISLPTLGLLPTEAPLAFTYGSHPKMARIVVSQGLLDQLEDDEIAAVYAGELAHIANWSFALMSLVAVVIQLPYVLYWQAARLSDWMQQRARLGQKENQWIALLLKGGATVIAIASTTSYGIFRLLRWSGLWLAKARIRYSDRAACNLTGNPNGLARAVLKIAIATTQTIQQHRQTDYLLEGFELLSPIGYRNALHIGSVTDQTALKPRLLWDQINPDRHWLALNNSHSLMGERCQQLMHYANYWQLEPEVELEPSPELIRSKIWLQGAPLWGVGIGGAIALLLWLTAHLAYRLGHQQLNWLATDYRLFFSFTLMGFGIGTILRFNSFFPDLHSVEGSAQASEQTALLPLIIQPDAAPVDSHPIRLTGTLLGRTGVGNALAQDLLLQTSDGLISLHYLSQLGAIGNLLPQPTRPQDLIQRSVVVTGWFRRGATPWVDVATIRSEKKGRSERGQSCRSGHQSWSALLAAIATLIGVLLIL
ncbi:MAG: M48 family metalloprotease [Myxacorys californica WJT36-NPBG1]|jgi:Zn-dependent protease with chaperone function|nr:M48 family metalloprotease [Myxacorys californica WJT36-NPBG1]